MEQAVNPLPTEGMEETTVLTLLAWAASVVAVVPMVTPAAVVAAADTPVVLEDIMITIPVAAVEVVPTTTERTL
jgi:hypothetical protein